MAEERIVDDRTFLLGLDKLYRESIKKHERRELLDCARSVAHALRIGPANVPVEGYYYEDELLTEYFLLMRGLQDVDADRESEVSGLAAFRRLLEVTSAPLYGNPNFDNGKLLPTGLDPLSEAMKETDVNDWTVQRLTETAHKIAVQNDDFSFVGLASLAKDSLVLAAVRESVVLYAMMMYGAAMKPKPPTYVWAVGHHLAKQAGRFIEIFNKLFDENLPPAEPGSAESYWRACRSNEIRGRCVRLGLNDAVTPVLNYHWAICNVSGSQFGVEEFWHPEIWTTQRYRADKGYRDDPFLSGCR